MPSSKIRKSIKVKNKEQLFSYLKEAPKAQIRYEMEKTAALSLLFKPGG